MTTEVQERMGSIEGVECQTTEQVFNTSVRICNGTCGVHDESYQLPLINMKYWIAVVYIALMALAFFLGTFGNIIILAVSIGARTINRIGRSFIINLALADMCVSAIADPMCIVGVIKGEVWFHNQWWLCQMIAAICTTACFCAFINLTMLTVNRYVFLCHNHIYNKIYSNVFCTIMCVVCWVVASLLEFPNFIGWGGYYFDQKTHQCTLNRTASFSYSLFVSTVVIAGPLVFMGTMYVLIFRRIWVRKLSVYKLNKDDPLWLRKARRDTVRSSRTLFVVFLVFLSCWTPYVIVTAIDTTNSFSMEIHLFITFLVHLHSSLNCIVYILFNKSFRKSFMRIIGCYKG